MATLVEILRYVSVCFRSRNVIDLFFGFFFLSFLFLCLIKKKPYGAKKHGDTVMRRNSSSNSKTWDDQCNICIFFIPYYVYFMPHLILHGCYFLYFAEYQVKAKFSEKEAKTDIFVCILMMIAIACADWEVES